jgi:lactoylglutathione lyase
VFVHTSIRTSNLDRAINFYSKFFGLKLLSRIEVKASDSEIAFMQDPYGKGAKLELTFYHNQTKFVQAPYEERLFDHLGFEVPNINDAINIMRKEGITITDEPYMFSKDGPIIAFIEDPDGNLIELIERK